MSETKPLSNIIWKGTDQSVPKGGFEQRVIIDGRTGTVTTSPPKLITPGLYHYFFVATSDDPSRIMSGTRQLKYKEAGEEIVFAIDYSGGCPRGQEGLLAQFYYRTADPEEAIRDTLAKSFIEYFSSSGRTIHEFFPQRNLAAFEITTKASQAFGLDLTITLRVDTPSQIETLEIGPVIITSRFSDSDEEESFWLRAELEVEQAHLLRALLNQGKPLTDLVKKCVRKYLAESVTLEMFYTDHNNEHLKQGLREELNKLLKTAGRKVSFISLKPDGLGPLVWLKGFDIEINNNSSNGHSSETMFVTSLPGVYAGLEIFVSTRVKDLRAIAPLLSGKVDVPHRMKEAIIRLVQKLLHGTEPGRFYLRFSRADEINYPKEEPLETELRRKIEHLLATEFNAEVTHLILKQTETPLTRKLELVSKAAHDFVIKAELGTMPGAPAIVVQGSFTVAAVSVDGWTTFLARDISVEALRKRIQASIRSSLKRIPNYGPIFVAQNSAETFIEGCLSSARKLVQKEFGVVIDTATVSWDWEERLKQIGNQRTNDDIAAVQKRIARLRETLLDLYEANGSQAAIDSVEEAIRRLNSVLPRAVGTHELTESATGTELRTGESDSPNLN